ncbi:LysR family transcriptional regulator [Alphaproteobacteria bacterium KMM 3653]|uniref:LysR family transcriptional regulator n=1 Tax=Harenicola maris TaxID=2841044 RepID=A0AAP2G7W9_9RHOB|nr:LysR family transcriptional regulator [Harenicola maris]
MIELRDMQLLVALARHKHFARAAADCGISQPAFSMRIRNLETEMDTAIVRRGNRFEGFTEEGEVILRWGRKMLEDAKAMGQEVGSVRGAVSGTLTIGVVPTALAYAAQIPALLRAEYPDVVPRILSATSLQIFQGMEDGTLDAGVTYGEGVPPDMEAPLPLYQERYVLLVPAALAPRAEGAATWAEAAAVPLTLLEPGMQNRRILNGVFAGIGAEPQVVMESNTFTACLAPVVEGVAATIVPEALVEALWLGEETRALPLTKPEESKAICLVTRSGSLATVAALKRVLGAVEAQ